MFTKSKYDYFIFYDFFKSLNDSLFVLKISSYLFEI